MIKPLPPAQIIAEYKDARKRLHGDDVKLEYVRGWFVYENSIRYRGAQIVRMTGQLWGRVQSRKADQ